MNKIVDSLALDKEPYPVFDVLPDYDSLRKQFYQKIETGEVIVERIDDLDENTDVGGATAYISRDTQGKFDSKVKEQLIEWSDKGGSSHLSLESIDEVDMDDELKAAAKDVIRQAELSSAFNYTYAQSDRGTWWLTQPTVPDANPWLADTEMHGVHEITVGDNKIFVTFMTEEVDPAVIGKGIGDVVARLALEGLDLSERVKWVNVVDESVYTDFKVPDHILEKFPTTYVAAMAKSQRSLITLNSKMFTKDHSKTKKDDEVLSLGDSWQETLIHELGHMYNLGLQDPASEYAKDMGWRRRSSIITDDQGDLIELNDSGDWFAAQRYVVDDYGNELSISGMKLPEQLVSGGFDESGMPIAPPSRYGNESSHEDLAESFLAYFSGVALDGLRRSVIEKLIADNQAVTKTGGIEVSSREIDIKKLDIWDYLPKHVRVRPGSIWI